ncbi:uncharacterized protein LOC113234052 [Hyposmocoma kahamanoa]|uniref:uncharacterized protein LOC113234052 n=1 Tax=Hyposmocoma kahamanoa TaxID=1477025 RepID=UPI000E6DA24B|nr:uncharacterized protein LOC113234052 [Hyposmocoma kahamanoa]
MTASFEDLVQDFDLSLLRQTGHTPNYDFPNKPEKLHQIANLKKRIIHTSSLIHKYHASQEEISNLNAVVLESKEKHRISVEHNALSQQKCTQLEKDLEMLQQSNKDLVEKVMISESRIAAMQSHTYQLETLIKEHETTILSTRKKFISEKDKLKDLQNKITELNKQKKVFMKHLAIFASVVFERRKLSQKKKAKFEIYKNSSLYKDDDIFSDEEIDGAVTSPFDSKEFLNNNNLQDLNCAIQVNVKELENLGDNIKKGLFELETIDIGSIDTGRGSSIASSPPEYFPDSPLNVEDVKNKVKLMDKSTSPPRFEPLSPTRKPKTTFADNSTNHKIIVDKAVSPIKFTDSLKFDKFGQTSSTFHNDNIAKYDVHESNNDREIELIFRNMRFEHSLITPMPTSPSRLSDVEDRSLSTIFESCEGADLAKLNDENKKLQSNIVLIKKEMMKLKRFVQRMGLDDEFNEYVGVSLINEINAEDTVALEIAEMENRASPVRSIDNDDNITLDLDDYEDHVTPPVNNDDVLLFEPDKTLLATLTEEQDSSNVECTENGQFASCKDCEASKKTAKARKLSKLDKLRKRMLPKSKIRRLGGPPKRLLRSMTKQLSPYSRSSPVLSKQQEAYAKAVLIWKQMSSKQKVIYEKGNAKPSISKETKNSNGHEYKTQSKNELSSNKQTNTSWKISETGNEKESYGIRTRKSSISLPDSPFPDHNNINSIKSDEALFMASLSEKVQKLQKEHTNIINTFKNTVQLSSGAKSLKVNSPAESDIRSKTILRSSSTTERNEDNSNKSNTDNVVLRSDLKSPSKNDPENIKIQTRGSIRRASQEAREKSDEEEISNNKDTHIENVNSPERRGRHKHLNKTEIQCRRILRSSNQLPDSPNSRESQKLGSSVSDTDTKQHGVPSQLQGYQSTSTDNTLICSGTNSRLSSIQQSDKKAPQEDCDEIDNDTSPLKRKGRKRKLQDIPAKQSKRTLRSSAVLQPSIVNNNDKMVANPSSATCNEMKHGDKVKSLIDDTEKETNRNLRNNKQQSNVKNKLDNNADNKNINNDYTETNATTNEKDSIIFVTSLEKQSNEHSNQVIFHEASEEPKNNCKQSIENDTYVSHTRIVDNRRNSIICKAIEKYRFNHATNSMKKLPDAVLDTISKKLEESIEHIIKLPVRDRIQGMNKLVEDISNLKEKHFIAGLMKYLSDPSRKDELYNKDNVHPAPSMSKSEQVLLYLLNKLKRVWPNIYDCLLKNIEYALFRLNRTPKFEIIESMSHFYAVVCRYIDDKSRLRLFLISAMYCIQFKSYPLIKQCLEVWMHILPLAHMGMAKSPLVTCCIYLLHFYKCEDKYNRVQDIRNILAKTYFYKTTEWNEPRILEMFKSAIVDLRDSPIERKMLRLALIILAKRHGPRWCQNNIIKTILKPLIEKENILERTKAFCISVLGALLKPYPADMKVHCEITINELLDMLKGNPSSAIQEAIYTSLIQISKHNQTRVVQALLSWCPQTISQDMKSVIKNFVKEKPVKIWKSVLSNIPLVE